MRHAVPRPYIWTVPISRDLMRLYSPADRRRKERNPTLETRNPYEFSKEEVATCRVASRRLVGNSSRSLRRKHGTQRCVRGVHAIHDRMQKWMIITAVARVQSLNAPRAAHRFTWPPVLASVTCLGPCNGVT